MFTKGRCSALVAVAAGAAGGAEAGIIVWENANLVIPNTIDGLYINVETKATGTPVNKPAGWDINPYSASSLTTLSWFNATGTGMMRYPGATSGSAAALTLGTTVGPTGSYGSGAVAVGSAAGNWKLNSDNYFGFKFVAADGLTHYGWGMMQVGAALSTRTLKHLAYESVGATAITVGAGMVPVPEPPAVAGATLLGLAAGARFVIKRRREASAKAPVA